MKTVEFKWELGNAVQTPLCVGIVTMLAFDAGGINYYVENGQQGVANKWWHERFLGDPAEQVEAKKEDK